MSLVEQAIARMRKTGTETSPVSTLPGAPAAAPAPEAQIAPSPEIAKPAKNLLLDMPALRAGGYLPEDSMDRRFADYFRQIKRPLLEKAFSGASSGPYEPHLIMVTSALAGEGKTFTSLNLALSIARERDVSVLLVDGDIPQPHLSRIFGVEQEPGLSDALIDESAQIESLVMSTDVRGLSYLPVGRPVDNAAELLTSMRMRQILSALTAADPRRLVLLDSPPLLMTSEGRAMVKFAAQVVLVVRAGNTPQRAVKDALAMFDQKQTGGIVLNEGQVGFTEGYYVYGEYGIDRNEISAKR